MIQVTPVILCGGSGTRLWPLSRSGFPKQFLCLTGAESLFQQAAKRQLDIGSERISVAAPIVVSNETHRFLLSEQLREAGVKLGVALLEPEGRNTAPALTIAALQALASGKDPVLVVTPADHAVADQPAFTLSIRQAVDEAVAGSIVILGIAPDRVETGYGYVKTAGCACAPVTSCPVTRFVEKPDAATAQCYLAEGGYFWNSGVFVLKASVWLEALECFRPDIHRAALLAWDRRSTDADFVRPGQAEFSVIPPESIDYAVMERCPGSRFAIRMVPLDAGWSDVGGWDAVWDVLPKDAAGNAHYGDVLLTSSRNTLVHATSRLVSVLGVENLVIIETPDAVLVADKARSQDVKHIVAALNQQRREEHNLHRKVHRPWGWYDSVDEGGRFKVKHIHVKPRASLSLQKHHHRSEHWVVVTGTAEITNGTEKILLTENQSTYVPLGQTHRLANPGHIPLEIIEVQSGSYLGEDDIVRYEDDYGR